MQLILYYRDTFKDTGGEKELAIANINTKYYDRQAIVVHWTKDRISIEREDIVNITMDNDGIVLTTKKGNRRYDEIEAITVLDTKTYSLIANIWGIITELWRDKQ